MREDGEGTDKKRGEGKRREAPLSSRCGAAHGPLVGCEAHGPPVARGDAEEPPADPSVGGLGDAHPHPHELPDRGGLALGCRRLAATLGAADALG
jgi:hypothetical protein